MEKRITHDYGVLIIPFGNKALIRFNQWAYLTFASKVNCLLQGVRLEMEETEHNKNLNIVPNNKQATVVIKWYQVFNKAMINKEPLELHQFTVKVFDEELINKEDEKFVSPELDFTLVGGFLRPNALARYTRQANRIVEWKERQTNPVNESISDLYSDVQTGTIIGQALSTQKVELTPEFEFFKYAFDIIDPTLLMSKTMSRLVNEEPDPKRGRIEWSKIPGLFPKLPKSRTYLAALNNVLSNIKIKYNSGILLKPEMDELIKKARNVVCDRQMSLKEGKHKSWFNVKSHENVLKAWINFVDRLEKCTVEVTLNLAICTKTVIQNS